MSMRIEQGPETSPGMAPGIALGIALGIAPGPLSLTAANSKALTEEDKRLGSERQLDKTPLSCKASELGRLQFVHHY